MIPVEWNKHNAEKVILDLETKPQTNFFKNPENTCKLIQEELWIVILI